jgi:hypothetical protein
MSQPGHLLFTLSQHRQITRDDMRPYQHSRLAYSIELGSETDVAAT